MVEQYFGNANWSQYGIPRNGRMAVRDAFKTVVQDSRQTERAPRDALQNIRTEGMTDDELYDSLLRTGAAISEQDALGESGVSFSDNYAQRSNLGGDTFQFSEFTPDPSAENSGFPDSIAGYDEETQKRIVRNFAEFEMSGVDTADRIILGMVPDRLADDVVRQSGVDIRGFKNVLHSDGLRHGAKHDVNTGNIPLTPDDVVGALDIFENYDKVTVTEKRGESSIKLQRTEPDGITYIAVIGKKKGHVFTKNIWKMVTTKDGSSRRTDATIAPASTPEAAANIKPSFDDSVTFAKTEYNGDQKSSQFNFIGQQCNSRVAQPNGACATWLRGRSRARPVGEAARRKPGETQALQATAQQRAAFAGRTKARSAPCLSTGSYRFTAEAVSDGNLLCYAVHVAV